MIKIYKKAQLDPVLTKLLRTISQTIKITSFFDEIRPNNTFF